MARKLPLCAKCGKHMRHSGRDRCSGGRVTMEYGNLPGHPMVGWHEGCLTRDTALWDAVLKDAKSDPPIGESLNLLRRIKSRGPGRVAGWEG
jgi:hypothetical protein